MGQGESRLILKWSSLLGLDSRDGNKTLTYKKADDYHLNENSFASKQHTGIIVCLILSHKSVKGEVKPRTGSHPNFRPNK